MIQLRVNQGSSQVVTFTLLNEAGTAIPSAQLAAATLSLTDEETHVPGASPVEGVINSRDYQNILNANNVTIHSTSGLVTWTMQPADNPILNPRRQIERHQATFRFAWSGGAFQDTIEIDVLPLPTSV